MFQYLPIENEMMSPYLGSYQTFGLRVCRIDTCTDEEIMCLPDISTNYFLYFALRNCSRANSWILFICWKY